MKERLASASLAALGEVGPEELDEDDDGKSGCADGSAEYAIQDYEALDSLLATPKRPGSSIGFQIAAIDALPCALW